MTFSVNDYLRDDANLEPGSAIENSKTAALIALLQQCGAFKVAPECEKSLEDMSFRRLNPVVCADGLSFSVQASGGHYCSPRNSKGPWTTVEIGFPNRKVAEFMQYAENPGIPTETVYGFVPVEVVDAVVNSRGGLAGSSV